MMVHFVSLKLLWDAVMLEGPDIKIFSNSAIQPPRANKHTRVTIKRGRVGKITPKTTDC